MCFAAGAPDLSVATHREDVVLDHVLLPVVLVEPTMGRPEDDVVLGDDSRRALVEVDAPGDRASGDVVKVVVSDHRSDLSPERIDPAHVAQGRLGVSGPIAEVIDLVELDEVPSRLRGAVSPGPPDRDARVVEFGDPIVRDPVVTGLTDP